MENQEFFYDANGFDMLGALADLIEKVMRDELKVGTDEWNQALREMPVDSVGQYKSVEFVQLKLEEILRARFPDTSRIERWRGFADQAVEDMHRLSQPSPKTD